MIVFDAAKVNGYTNRNKINIARIEEWVNGLTQAQRADLHAINEEWHRVYHERRHEWYRNRDLRKDNDPPKFAVAEEEVCKDFIEEHGGEREWFDFLELKEVDDGREETREVQDVQAGGREG